MAQTIEYNEAHARVPIIALDYSQRHLRRLKELMIDYNNGNLYVVDANDKDIIYSVTDRIIENITGNLTGDDIIVNITGVGEINLTKFLESINSDMIGFEVTDNGGDFPSMTLDNESIESLDGTIQLCNFDEADDNTLPQKVNGRLQWTRAGAGMPGSTVREPTISNNNISLSVDTTNRSSSLPSKVTVNLGDDFVENYGKIVWNIAITSTIPKLTFASNVKFLFNTDTDLFANSIVTFEFESFNRGSTWLCKVYKWLNISEKEITETYIVDKLSWKYIGQ